MRNAASRDRTTDRLGCVDSVSAGDATAIRAVASVWPYITTKSQPASRPRRARPRTAAGSMPTARLGDEPERRAFAARRRPSRSIISNVYGTPASVVTPQRSTAAQKHGSTTDASVITTDAAGGEVGGDDRQPVAVVQRQRRDGSIAARADPATRRSRARSTTTASRDNRTSFAPPVVPDVLISSGEVGVQIVRRRLSPARSGARCGGRRHAPATTVSGRYRAASSASLGPGSPTISGWPPSSAASNVTIASTGSTPPSCTRRRVRPSATRRRSMRSARSDAVTTSPDRVAVVVRTAASTISAGRSPRSTEPRGRQDARGVGGGPPSRRRGEVGHASQDRLSTVVRQP